MLAVTLSKLTSAIALATIILMALVVIVLTISKSSMVLNKSARPHGLNRGIDADAARIVVRNVRAGNRN